MEIVQNSQEKISDTLKIIDFWASWCGPCKALKPIIDSIESEYADKVDLLKVEIDNPINKAIVEKYAVQSVPTVVFEKRGQEIARLVGLNGKETYTKIIENNLPKEL